MKYPLSVLEGIHVIDIFFKKVNECSSCRDHTKCPLSALEGIHVIDIF